MSNVSEFVDRRIAAWDERDANRRGELIARMKVLGTSAALIGALTLMLTVIIAQRDYQRSWDAGAVAQTSTISKRASA